jgi:hypothetical protein
MYCNECLSHHADMKEMQTPHGLYWECPIAPDEPFETYEMGKRVAATVADFAAYKTAKHYVVAASREPMTLYVLAASHPDLPRSDMTVLWESAPSGPVVRPS